MMKTCLAVIGLGHWGPNLLRNFLDCDRAEVKYVCDLDTGRLDRIALPGDRKTTDSNIVLQDPAIKAVVISTPVATHYDMVKAALNAGKHVFVEKPVTMDVAEAVELDELAAEKGLQLMVGHIFMYNDGIRYAKQLIDAGELGRIQFIQAQRTNLGPVRSDVNAFWDLATHDISIINYWLNGLPERVSACYSNLIKGPMEDVANVTLMYPGPVSCQLLASWIHPKKVRQIIVVGEKKMLIWDDMKPFEPIRIFDKCIEPHSPPEQVSGTLAEFNFSINNGDMLVPFLKLRQPLLTECLAFLDAVESGTPALSDGHVGVDVVKVLAASDESHRQNSAFVSLG